MTGRRQISTGPDGVLAWNAGLQTGTRGAPSRARRNSTQARWRLQMLLRHPCVRQ